MKPCGYGWLRVVVRLALGSGTAASPQPCRSRLFWGVALSTSCPPQASGPGLGGARRTAVLIRSRLSVDATAVVAVVSVLVSGGLSPWLAGRIAARRFEAEKRRDREDELRAVLENAGVQLTETFTVVRPLFLRMSELGDGRIEPARRAMEQLWKNDDRLSVRLGSGAPEVQKYREAIEAVAKVMDTFEEGLVAGFNSTRIEQAQEAFRRANEIQPAFYDVASQRIGPGDQTPPARRLLSRRADTSPKLPAAKSGESS